MYGIGGDADEPFLRAAVARYEARLQLEVRQRLGRWTLGVEAARVSLF
jgi:hypothetical protein